MKNFFYIHILLMTATSLITYTQQYNNSTAIVSQTAVISQNGLMQHFNPYQGTQYHKNVFVANNTPRNRKERRAQGVPKHRSQYETKKVTIDDELERISNKIDKKIIGIKGEGSCCSHLVDFFSKEIAYIKVSGMNKKSIVHALKDIDDIIQAEQLGDSSTIIPRLAEKNVIFSLLVKCLVKDDKWITGSTVDRAFNFEFLFPFSDSLYRFIEKKKEVIENKKESSASASINFPTGKQLLLFLGSHNLEEKVKAYHSSGSLDVFLCKVAFQNSMDDNEELDALLDSNLVKNDLEGSPYKKELVQAISEQKENNNNKKWW